MAYDSINNTYWAYTTNTIFELVVTKEDRNVWELYLEKKQFETALQYCKVIYFYSFVFLFPFFFSFFFFFFFL